MKLFKHQEEMASFINTHDRVFCTSDPGTGKTIGSIEGFLRCGARRMLVIAPLSILEASWGDDIERYAPELSWGIAHGRTREEVVTGPYDIVITNHDAVKWLADMPKETFETFDMMVIDESTAFKNRTSQRSKAVSKLIQNFPKRVLLTGTPNSNTVLDLWHQAYLLDQGVRLGARFFSFRQQVCTPVQVGPDTRMVQWQDKPGATETVASMLSDITIRHRFEDCIDIPKNTTRYIYTTLPPKIRKAYYELMNTSFLETDGGEVSAIHGGARVKKLLQLLTGAIYSEDGQPLKVHEERYQLVMGLVAERKKSIVAFNWTHEREALAKIAEKMGIKFGIIDGKTPVASRADVVRDFQTGDLQVVFAHPQSAGHGLTLTAGQATIWCSPTYNAEHFQQFNRRIYRAGQDKETETICIAARDTKEEEVYEKLGGKLERMDDLLSVFRDITLLKSA